jgi:hypothetical protein
VKRYAARRDANEATLLAGVEALGGLWLPAGPFDGWLWDRRAWRLVEIKRPERQGRKDEFTEEQRRLILRLNERAVPFHVLRTEDDVLALMGARRTA